jgi:hypothetical protein
VIGAEGESHAAHFMPAGSALVPAAGG